MVAIRLRPGGRADIGFIHSLEQRNDNAAFIFRWSEAHHEASLKENDKRYLIGVDAENRPQGFAILHNIGENTVPYLVRIAVAEPGRGVGHALLKQVCDWVFAQSAAPRLELDVFEDNLRAQALYRRLGFIVDRVSEDTVDRPNGQPARLVYMSLARSVT